ncbi:hypothetical protein M8494_23970 [Serratia ureilytica]
MAGADAAAHWRLYLRPAIHFHHGRELEMADVITSLSRLTSQPLFSHIESVTSPTPFVIDVQLRSPDHWLPGCWAACRP